MGKVAIMDFQFGQLFPFVYLQDRTDKILGVLLPHSYISYQIEAFQETFTHLSRRVPLYIHLFQHYF